MTEKRFIYDEFEDCIIDNLTGKTYWGLDDTLNNKLNELHEENQLLKLQSETKLFSRRELEKENEQLKKEVEDLKQAVIRAAFDMG